MPYGDITITNWNKYISMVLGDLEYYLTDTISYPYPMIRIKGKGPSLRLCSEMYIANLHDLANTNCRIYDLNYNLIADYTDDLCTVIHYIYSTDKNNIYLVESDIEEKDNYMTLFFSDYIKNHAIPDHLYYYEDNYLFKLSKETRNKIVSIWFYTDGDFYNKRANLLMETDYPDADTRKLFTRTGYIYS